MAEISHDYIIKLSKQEWADFFNWLNDDWQTVPYHSPARAISAWFYDLVTAYTTE